MSSGKGDKTGKKGESAPGLTILLVPDGSTNTRGVKLSYSSVRILAASAAALLLFFVVMVASWWRLAATAATASGLRLEVDTLVANCVQAEELALRVDSLRARYDRLRSLFGTEMSPGESGIWLPPAGGREGGRSVQQDQEDEGTPNSWPLTRRGFITQHPTLPVDGGGEHPGLDIAIPRDSYIRASGSGSVAEVGEDSIYGRYIVLEHQGGYSSRYAHASETLVREGQEVRRNEVIALSGSSGRSTAPHLHFEILLNGVPIDPMSLLARLE